MKAINYFTLIICLLIPLLIGSISGYATINGGTWYAELNKPSFNPPDFIFGPVWTVLYVLMGVSLYIVWMSPPGDAKENALLVFSIQLLLNFAWTFMFFYFKLIGPALIEIVVLWVSILMMIFTFHRIDKAAAYIQIPYIFWVSFASILNGFIWKLN